MQFAVAAYACPGLQGQPMARMAAPVQHDSGHHMEGCDGMMAAAQPAEPSALCQAHCQPPGQSLDRPALPDVAPFIPAQLITLMSGPALAPPAALEQGGDNQGLLRTTSPPLAIRHCCFRI